eukprot:m51a1_g3210 hypothetical protein (304) ;mRNA; f:29795-31294
MNTALCSSALVARVAQLPEFATLPPSSVTWGDAPAQTLDLARSLSSPCPNHILGAQEIAMKQHLARNIARMAAVFAREYAFAPPTWVAPAETQRLLAWAAGHRGSYVIAKPSVGCEGCGIALVPCSDVPALERSIGELVGRHAHVVVQEYVQPLVLDVAPACRRKFDLRVYAVVARDLWQEIARIVLLTVISGHPTMEHLHREAKAPRGSFEIFGFDILLDSACRPTLIEVNQYPSLGCDAQIDTDVKEELVRSVLSVVRAIHLGPAPGVAPEAVGSLKRIYPASSVAATVALRKYFNFPLPQ